MSHQEKVRHLVRNYYTEALERGRSALRRGSTSCCSGDAADGKLVELAGYQADDLASLPDDAVQSSFGCGNPVSFAGVEAGQIVVDIGSGAGIDCLLAAERVGPDGRVIGLDMTPAMIERARANAREAGKDNVEFRLGDAESMPIDDSSVDWIISNCVINLSPDKKRVFAEAYRVLRPGGRISVSDIVADIPRILRTQSLYASCLSGALPEKDYLAAITAAGFEDVKIVARHHYEIEQLATLLGENRLVGRLFRLMSRPWLQSAANRILRRVASIQVMASKPRQGQVAA